MFRDSHSCLARLPTLRVGDVCDESCFSRSHRQVRMDLSAVGRSQGVRMAADFFS